jgi:hypothetical protein
MIKNRKFALIYRIIAAALCVFGIFVELDLHLDPSLYFHHSQLLYFTFQSNLLVFVAFVVLSVKTGKDIKKDGNRGSSFYYPSICAALLVSIMMTMIIFWLILLPYITHTNVLSTYGNISTHAINPLLFLLDYVLFSTSPHLTRKDPLKVLVFPVFYVVQASILGAAGVKFHTPFADRIANYPYIFLDWSIYGGFTILFIIAMAAVFVAAGYLLYFIDCKRNNRQKSRC